MKTAVQHISFLFFFLVLSTNISFAQHTEKSIRAHIRGQLKKIDTSKGDLLVKENMKLMNYLAKVCKEEPGTLHMKFPGLGDDFTIINSDDGKMRVYYWDTHIDRTVYFELAQFQSGNGVKIARWNEDSGKIETVGRGVFTPSKIVSVRIADSNTVYLVISDVRYGQGTFAEKIEAYIVDKDILMEKPFFKTTTGTKDMISDNYDPTYEQNSSVNSSIHVSKDKQKLYIPLIIDGNLKKSFLVYLFDGNNYVFDKNGK